MKLFLALFALLSLSGDINVSVMKEGLLRNDSPYMNSIVMDNKEFKKLWNELGIEGQPPKVNFKNEVVVLIAPMVKSQKSIGLSRVTKSGRNTIEVGYKLLDAKDLSVRDYEGKSPYILAKIYPVEVKKLQVKIIQDIDKPVIPSDSGIGQFPKYSNILKEDENLKVSRYVPLDKGNVWKYEFESNGQKSQHVFKILTIADGWSVYDRFFGKNNVALRIDPGGNIIVSSDNGVSTFYRPDIQRSYEKSEFNTPAGKFKELMIITIPENSDFWFKDIYAKGVGLIYHEHKSSKGDGKYTLVEAKVRGKKYP